MAKRQENDTAGRSRLPGNPTRFVEAHPGQLLVAVRDVPFMGSPDVGRRIELGKHEAGSRNHRGDKHSLVTDHGMVTDAMAILKSLIY